jgi:hypothetical protein
MFGWVRGPRRTRRIVHPTIGFRVGDWVDAKFERVGRLACRVAPSPPRVLAWATTFPSPSLSVTLPFVAHLFVLVCSSSKLFGSRP